MSSTDAIAHWISTNKLRSIGMHMLATSPRHATQH